MSLLPRRWQLPFFALAIVAAAGIAVFGVAAMTIPIVVLAGLLFFAMDRIERGERAARARDDER